MTRSSTDVSVLRSLFPTQDKVNDRKGWSNEPFLETVAFEPFERIETRPKSRVKT